MRSMTRRTALGCAAATTLAVAWAPAAETKANLYFPPHAGEWRRAGAGSGWDTKRVEAALTMAMKSKSTSVVILHQGRILGERHAAGQEASRRLARMTKGRTAAGHAIEDVASVQKSVVSFLVGVAQEKGLVRLSDPVVKHLGPGWSKAEGKQEAAITLRHLITMTSGLDTRLRFVASPGSRWRYNTTAYSKSLTVVAKASGKSENDLTKQWLTGPIGMRDSKWVRRPQTLLSGVDANSFGFATSSRDLARFGLLMLAQGKWERRSLLGDAAYLREATSSSQRLNPAYGYLWWLNGKAFALRGVRKVNGSLIPTAPADMYAAMGALGRKCYVAPSLQLVVARLGDTPDGVGQSFDREFWRLLMQAAPR